MLPVTPVTELTEGTVDIPRIVLTELSVLLLVAFDEEDDTAETTKVSLRTCICLRFMGIIFNVETTK